jgi:K+-sensing histidine kinase KdpD
VCIILVGGQKSDRLESSHVKLPFNNPILRLITCAVIVAGIVMVFWRWLHVNPTTVGFSLLIAVLLISTTWGLRYATFTALLATAAYNFFFLPPLFKFTIADPQNWIALAAFLVTAGIASQLAERARRGTEYADQRRREVERLYAFSQKMFSSCLISFPNTSQTHLRLAALLFSSKVSKKHISWMIVAVLCFRETI